MYILIVARGYPTEKYKMNGIFEFDQAKALAKAGHKVIYAALDMRSIRRRRKWGFESFKKDGVQIEAVNVPCGRIPKTVLNEISLIALKKLYKKIENKYGRPDIIHAHFVGVGYTAARAFERDDRPLILTEHLSSMNKKNISPYLFKLGSYTYHRVNKVIAVGNNLANSIKEKFSVESTVIPNIVDTTNFAYKGSNPKSHPFFNFISTGSLIQRKSMDLLIEAFFEAFQGNKNIKLLIFGEGPERPKLEKMIQELGLKDNVFLMGMVDRKEIAKTMSESDCFVLASKLETFGVAYIEAIAMGLPVIATKCGGPEDFVNTNNGILIPVDDKNALISAMQNMLNKAGTYDHKKISDTIKKQFAPENIAKQLTKIYEEILCKDNK
jgi:glycosyltransferase involved in cell wall biosynthesis